MGKYIIQFQVECEKERLFLVPPSDLVESERMAFAIESMLQNPIEQALMKLVQDMGINNIANIGVSLADVDIQSMQANVALCPVCDFKQQIDQVCEEHGIYKIIPRS